MHPTTSSAPPGVPAAPAAGDFAALAARLRPALWRYVRVLGADASSADDVVQEALLVALRRPGFDAREPGAVFTFLRTTCRQLWQRSRRCRAAVRELDEADAVWNARCGDGPGEHYLDALRACVAALPQRGRALLAATYGEGDGRSASGARFGIGVHGVKSALRRLRAALHACITRRLARET